MLLIDTHVFGILERCQLITHDGKIKMGYPEVNVIW